MEAADLRRRAEALLERAKREPDPEKHMVLIKLAVAFLAKARELDADKEDADKE